MPYFSSYIRSEKPVILSSRSHPETTTRTAYISFLNMGGKALIPLSMNHATEIHTRWIDIDWMERCISQCDQAHECRQESFGKNFAMKPSWLVDVCDFCLVKFPSNAEYFALSYVWGGVEQLLTTRANHDFLRIPGALNPERGGHSLPKTILHAMLLTARLGKRYIWVDALCIIQDDNEHKHSELSNMSGIFANASVTLIAANGKNSNSGLPGLLHISEPRSLNLEGCRINKNLTVYYRSAHDPSTAAHWASRGWTFQESFFSKRQFLFYGGFVEWRCPEHNSREFVFSVNGDEWMGKHDFPINLDRSVLIPRRGLDKVSPINELFHHVSSFNGRLLTYPEDALGAFAGVATFIDGRHVGGYVSGLPILFFNRALLWQSARSLYRRYPKKRTESVCLPSWSWCGWSGPIEEIIFPTSTSLDTNRASVVESLLQWQYHQKRNDHGVLIDYRWTQYQDRFKNNMSFPVPSGWKRHVTTDIVGHLGYCSPKGILVRLKDEVVASNLLLDFPTHDPHDEDLRLLEPEDLPYMFYTHASAPGKLYEFPLPSCESDVAKYIYAPFISCTTSIAWFRAGANISNRWDRNKIFIPIRDNSGTPVGYINVQQSRDAHILPEDASLELIELAQGRGEMLNHRPFTGILKDAAKHLQSEIEYYYVMWITRQDEISYRAGLGFVLKNSWDAAPKKQERVMLG